jgi:hypothetical protein
MSVVREPGMPRLRSRIHGSRRVLNELRRLHLKVAAAGVYRAVTDEERLWCSRVGDALEVLIREGDAVLPASMDPRPGRTVRKRRPTPVRML